jgi:hypothetical protein
VAGDREQPGRNRSARFERGRLPPNVEEDFAEQIFGQCLVSEEPNQPPINSEAVTREQRAHRASIAGRDPLDQNFVGKVFGCRRLFGQRGGRTRMGVGHRHRDSPF